MGFALRYRSTRPVTPAVAAAIADDVRSAALGRTWLSCEPVYFHPTQEDGHLFGSSKPNFQPHPDDVEAAKLAGLPDGTTTDLVEILCQVSRDHGIDWEFSHDADPGPIGYIRAGVCDEAVRNQAEIFAELAAAMADDLDHLESFADGDLE